MIRLPDQTTELAGLGGHGRAWSPRWPRGRLRDPAVTVLDVDAVATGYAVHEHRDRRAAPGRRHRAHGRAATRPVVGVREAAAPPAALAADRHGPAAGRGERSSSGSPGGTSSTHGTQVRPVLPPGLRVPEEYAVADLGDDRLAWWMEDVDDDDDRVGRRGLRASRSSPGAAGRTSRSRQPRRQQPPAGRVRRPQGRGLPRRDAGRCSR